MSLEIIGLSKHYGRDVVALNDVSLQLRQGECFGLIGESGSGKTTLTRCILGLEPPTSGRILFDGVDITRLGAAAMRRMRARIQIVFQDPYASLNPRMSAHDIIAEPMIIHRATLGLEHRARTDRVVELLGLVGLGPQHLSRFPHEFSGGQRQRIGIARALAVQPEFLVCDEAVAALDVSIQAQILNLFMDLREQLDLTYLFISHDLGVVEHLSDRVVIMYLGRIVEEAPAEEIFARANHPYTQALLAEVPRIDTRKRQFTAIKGEIPSPLNPPPGCHFHPRCPAAMALCRAQAPVLREVAPSHRSACHLNG